MLTVDELKKALPAQLKTQATQSLVDKVNQISGDPEFAEQVRNSFLSYTQVLKDGQFKIQDYLNAVVYVSFKMMGFTNQEAYKRAFPDRHSRLVLMGASEKDISAYVAAYNKNKLVNLIMEQTLVPTWVLNADIYQKAINVQAELMLDTTVSPKVRTDAANSLLTHLKRPETKQVEVSLGTQESEGLNELKNMLTSLAQQQQDLIAQGIPTVQIAHQKLGQALPADTIESTAKDVTPEE